MSPVRRQRLVRALLRLVDVTLVALSLPLAIELRLDHYTSPRLGLEGLLVAMATQAVMAAVIFWWRPSRAMWRYTSTRDVVLVLQNVTLLQMTFLATSFFVTRLEGLPRSVFLIQWLLLSGMLVGVRVAYRLFREGHLRGWHRREDDGDRLPAVLVGSGDDAEVFIRAVQRDRSFGFRLVGLVEEDGSLVGLEIHGVPVVGGLEQPLVDTMRRLESRGHRPRKLLVAGGRVEGARVARLVAEAQEIGLSIARVADPKELLNGTGAAGLQIQPVAVEDLLNRPQTSLNYEEVRHFLNGRRVLVTGAGGSIGSELVRQICMAGPSAIALVDASEHNLYQIEHEVARRWPSLTRHAILGDVRQLDALDRQFDRLRPEVVFHAAALKHVPMVEHNPSEGVLTNVLGSRHVADLCVKHEVGTMVMVSTDKAVRPTNVMGATKRLAECYCQSLDALQGEAGTRFVTVRFGNVLGSSGSVVPLFERQLREGGPLTVTHPDIIRYFMTIREAVQLVLQAGALPSEGDESGTLFVLEMGEPVKIVDLARQMIRLAGLQPDVDVEIRFTGLRPGEKLYEELFYDNEDLLPTGVPHVMRARPLVREHAALVQAMDALLEVALARQDEDIRPMLARCVDDYQAAGGQERPSRPPPTPIRLLQGGE